MAFILAEHRDAGDDVVSAFQRYRDYLHTNKSRFPPRSYELASSDWYFSFEDHRCPHDAWLESATIEERAEGKKGERSTIAIRVRLLGAYQDGHLEFYYPRVFEYHMDLGDGSRGHQDWRYDEFRLSSEGHVIHEIEWSGLDETGRWIIEASDVEYLWSPNSTRT